MRLELQESFCYLLCSLSEVGRRGGASYKSAISDHCPLFFSSLDEYYFFFFSYSFSLRRQHIFQPSGSS